MRGSYQVVMAGISFVGVALAGRQGAVFIDPRASSACAAKCDAAITLWWDIHREVKAGQEQAQIMSRQLSAAEKQFKALVHIKDYDGARKYVFTVAQWVTAYLYAANNELWSLDRRFRQGVIILVKLANTASTINNPKCYAKLSDTMNKKKQLEADLIHWRTQNAAMIKEFHKIIGSLQFLPSVKNNSKSNLRSATSTSISSSDELTPIMAADEIGSSWDELEVLDKIKIKTPLLARVKAPGGESQWVLVAELGGRNELSRQKSLSILNTRKIPEPKTHNDDASSSTVSDRTDGSMKDGSRNKKIKGTSSKSDFPGKDGIKSGSTSEGGNERGRGSGTSPAKENDEQAQLGTSFVGASKNESMKGKSGGDRTVSVENRDSSAAISVLEAMRIADEALLLPWDSSLYNTEDNTGTQMYSKSEGSLSVGSRSSRTEDKLKAKTTNDDIKDATGFPSFGGDSRDGEHTGGSISESVSEAGKSGEDNSDDSEGRMGNNSERITEIAGMSDESGYSGSSEGSSGYSSEGSIQDVLESVGDVPNSEWRLDPKTRREVEKELSMLIPSSGHDKVAESEPKTKVEDLQAMQWEMNAIADQLLIAREKIQSELGGHMDQSSAEMLRTMAAALRRSALVGLVQVLRLEALDKIYREVSGTQSVPTVLGEQSLEQLLATLTVDASAATRVVSAFAMYFDRAVKKIDTIVPAQMAVSRLISSVSTAAYAAGETTDTTNRVVSLVRQCLERSAAVQELLETGKRDGDTMVNYIASGLWLSAAVKIVPEVSTSRGFKFAREELSELRIGSDGEAFIEYQRVILDRAEIWQHQRQNLAKKILEVGRQAHVARGELVKSAMGEKELEQFEYINKGTIATLRRVFKILTVLNRNLGSMRATLIGLDELLAGPSNKKIPLFIQGLLMPKVHHMGNRFEQHLSSSESQLLSLREELRSLPKLPSEWSALAQAAEAAMFHARQSLVTVHCVAARLATARLGRAHISLQRSSSRDAIEFREGYLERVLKAGNRAEQAQKYIGQLGGRMKDWMYQKTPDPYAHWLLGEEAIGHAKLFLSSVDGAQLELIHMHNRVMADPVVGESSSINTGWMQAMNVREKLANSIIDFAQTVRQGYSRPLSCPTKDELKNVLEKGLGGKFATVLKLGESALLDYTILGVFMAEEVVQNILNSTDNERIRAMPSSTEQEGQNRVDAQQRASEKFRSTMKSLDVLHRLGYCTIETISTEPLAAQVVDLIESRLSYILEWRPSEDDHDSSIEPYTPLEVNSIFTSAPIPSFEKLQHDQHYRHLLRDFELAMRGRSPMHLLHNPHIPAVCGCFVDHSNYLPLFNLPIEKRTSYCWLDAETRWRQELNCPVFKSIRRPVCIEPFKCF